MKGKFEDEVEKAVELGEVTWLARQLREAYSLILECADMDFEEEVIPTPDGFVTVSAKLQDLDAYLDLRERLRDFLAWGDGK